MIFVEGAPRSGTTLLVSILATHPQIAGTVAESHLFDQGVDRLFENAQRPERYEPFLAGYVSVEELTELVRALCDGVLTSMRDRVKPEAERVIEKTPAPRSGARAVTERKLAIYPDATYVHVVRDRDAVVRSLDRAPWADVSRSQAAAWWTDAVAGIRGACAASTATYIEIAYEHLAADPVGAVETLLEKLRLKTSEEVRARIEVASRERLSTFGSAPRPGSGRTDSTGGRGVVVERAGRLRKAAGLARRFVPGGSAQAALLAQELIAAARSEDIAAVARLTHDSFAFDLRSGAGDLAASGGEGRALLVDVTARMLSRRAVSETWTVVADGSLTTLLLAATYGDGRRSDAVIAAHAEEGKIVRLGLIAAGDPAGRVPSEWAPGSGLGR